MPVINADTAPFWRQLAADLSLQRPNPGRTVEVTGGRKHKGKRGVVRRHQMSKYGDAFRYGGEANLHMREMAGRSGFCVLVEQEDGTTFWCPAENVTCIAEVQS